MNFWGVPIGLNAVPTNPVDTDVSTRDTIHQMIAIARDSSSSPTIAAIVNSCLVNLPQKHSKRDLVRAIYWWVKNHVKFREDEDTLAQQLGYTDVRQELLIDPRVLVNMPVPMGDCDDFSMLAASLLLCTQVPCRFVTIAVDKDAPFRFSHVYVMAYLNDEARWIALDCSHGSGLGWEYKGQIFRKMEWNI